MAFINTATGKYPLHAGDVALDRDAPWAFVEDTAKPPLADGEAVREGAPVCGEDGIWRQTWEIVTLTPEQIAAREEAKQSHRLRGKGHA